MEKAPGTAHDDRSRAEDAEQSNQCLPVDGHELMVDRKREGICADQWDGAGATEGTGLGESGDFDQCVPAWSDAIARLPTGVALRIRSRICWSPLGRLTP